MSPEEIRLELVKLTHSLGRDVKDAVDRAKILEDYVFSEKSIEPKQSAEESKPSLDRSKKKSAKPDPFN